MFEPVKISPSLLSANFMELDRELDAIARSGADWVHVDVMDGHFVPNITMGVPFVKALRKSCTLPCDVHLMVANPLEQIPWFIESKPDVLTIHWEALDTPCAEKQAHDSVRMIHEAGCRAGIALKPDTDPAVLQNTIAIWDMILVMSVFPGFSGQSYIEGSDARIAEVVSLCQQQDASPLIQVDGGIGEQTAAKVVAAGADVLVAGNAVFKAGDYARAIASIRGAAQQVQAV